jgi:hypothetical protein
MRDWTRTGPKLPKPRCANVITGKCCAEHV